MSPDITSINGAHSHLLTFALLNFGVSPGAAFQFMQGLPIASQEDRDALRAMFFWLTMTPGSGFILRSFAIKKLSDQASPAFFRNDVGHAQK
jgi:hypothetical protein